MTDPMKRPITPELRSIPITRFDCECRSTISGNYNGINWESVEPCCCHKNYPWVEFPRGSGKKDPLYCDVACKSGLCPLGMKA